MTKILHRIKAVLYPNLLTDDPNDFSARVITERTLSTEEICKTAITRGGASSTAEAMEHNVNLFFKEMAYQLSDGYSVNTGYFTATTLIKGVFNSPTQTFDTEKHSVLFQFNQGDLLRKELPGIKVDITGVGESSITIAQVTDVKSGSVNDKLTPGRNLRVKGYKLKLAGEHTNVGVYFVNTATEARVKVAKEDIVTNNPSELIIVTPNLAAGSYRLEVTSQFAGNTLLKEPRTAVFEATFTVTV